MVEFLPIDPHAAGDWDDFVRASPDGWVWGLAGWQRLIERVETWRLKPLSFEMRENGRRVAIMPLHLNAAGIAASSGWGWVGPMLAPGLSSERRRSLLKRVMAHAEAVAKETGATALALGSMPITHQNISDTTGVNPCFEFGYTDLSTHSRIIDLDQAEGELWRGLSEFARRRIRNAERLGWRAERVQWAEHLTSYYELHDETYRRTGVPSHPRSYFMGLAEEMAPAGHAILWTGRNENGTECAYVNVGSFGEVSYYHTGCSNAVALDEGGNYLVMWHAILDAKMRGHRCFDIGEVFFDVRDGKQRGLTEFKTKFGGELRRFYKARKQFGEAAAAPVATANEGTLRRLFGRAMGRRS